MLTSLQQDDVYWTDEKTLKKKKKRKPGKKNQKLYSSLSSEQPRSEAKSLFDSLKVVSLPAFLSPLLLVVRDTSVLHLQLRLAAQVHKRHRDRCIMLWNEHATGERFTNDVDAECGMHLKLKSELIFHLKYTFIS